MMFMAGMVIPVWLQVGSLVLMPHRLVILITFIPNISMIFSGKAGKIRPADWFMVFSSLWAAIALFVNGGLETSSLVQQAGIYALETTGAYFLGRVAIRTSDDFLWFVKFFFATLLVLVPFGAAEALTHRAILLEAIPKSTRIVYTTERWGMRRAQTVFGHPILFGIYSGAGIGICWYVLRDHFKRLFGAFISVMGTVFSLSSGALMSVTFQMLFIGYELVTRPAKKRWTVFAWLSVAGYVIVDLLSNRTPFHLVVAYMTFNSTSAYNRILIWRFGMENVWENPYFGLGANIWKWKRPYWMSSSADNFWLVQAMKYGIPCFLFLALALFFIIRYVSKKELTDPLDKACRAGFLTTLGGLIFAAATVHYWHNLMAFYFFFIGAGVYLMDIQNRAPGEIATKADQAPEGIQYAREAPRHVRERPVPKRRSLKPHSRDLRANRQTKGS